MPKAKAGYPEGESFLTRQQTSHPIGGFAKSGRLMASRKMPTELARQIVEITTWQREPPLQLFCKAVGTRKCLEVRL
ncbi:MAG: hypothetical protein KDJ69_00875 [Nitratireductor sp.]|nr:hypothetical protein [Nitratireductor sp.]